MSDQFKVVLAYVPEEFHPWILAFVLPTVVFYVFFVLYSNGAPDEASGASTAFRKEAGDAAAEEEDAPAAGGSDGASLWDRMGGEEKIRPMVDQLYDEHLADTITKSYFNTRAKWTGELRANEYGSCRLAPTNQAFDC